MPIRLVTIPSGDADFRTDAADLLAALPADIDTAKALQSFRDALRERYPTAVVQPQRPVAKVPLDAEDVWYVFRHAYRSRISTSIVVPLVPKDAFALYTERVVQWQSAVQLTAIRRTRSLVGDEYDASYILLGRQFHGRFRIVDADPPVSLTTEAAGSGIRVWYVTRFTREEEATRVTVEGDYDLPDGIVPRIAGRLFLERTIERDIESAHATFLALCERFALGGHAAARPQE